MRYTLEDYRDIETVNLYRERREAGFSHESVMESIYAKSRDNARTPMQWDELSNYSDNKKERSQNVLCQKDFRTAPVEFRTISGARSMIELMGRSFSRQDMA